MQGGKIASGPKSLAFISKDLSVSTGYETASGTPIGLLRDAPGTAGRLADTGPAWRNSDNNNCDPLCQGRLERRSGKACRERIGHSL
jgi:hypothetical protein